MRCGVGGALKERTEAKGGGEVELGREAKESRDLKEAYV